MEEVEKVRLFVYGTLRRRGVANHYLLQYQVKEENIWLPGFAMYDAGWYPFVVPANGALKIVGDVYEIPEWKTSVLDDYEGPEYERIWLPELEAQIYIKADRQAKGFMKVEGGDWLRWWKEKNG